MVTFDVEWSFIAEAVGMGVTSVLLTAMLALSIGLEQSADTQSTASANAESKLTHSLPYYLRRRAYRRGRSACAFAGPAGRVWHLSGSDLRRSAARCKPLHLLPPLPFL